MIIYIKSLWIYYLTLRNIKDNHFRFIINIFIELCGSINDFLFIKKIIILINFIKETEYENYKFSLLNIIRINDSLDEYYEFCKTGYDIFIKVLDKLEEKMQLYINLIAQ